MAQWRFMQPTIQPNDRLLVIVSLAIIVKRNEYNKYVHDNDFKSVNERTMCGSVKVTNNTIEL